MYLQIEDPSEAPVPPEEVRIKAVELQPYSDGRRAKMILKLTPFQAPPNIAVTIEDARGEKVSSLDIIGATESTMSLTVHIRDPHAEDPLDVHLAVSYEDEGIVDRHKEILSLSGGDKLG
jgi:hypothetical protein